jgi:hypothetical protein
MKTVIRLLVLLALYITPSYAGCPYSFVCDQSGCSRLSECSSSQSRVSVNIPSASGVVNPSAPPSGATTTEPAFSRPAPTPGYVPLPTYPVPGCSESGSCNGDISSITGLPKTNYVNGYFRSDGTYVGSYYRSHR